MKLFKRATYYARRGLQIVRATRKGKSSLKAQLIEHQPLMQPGFYWLDSSVAYRLGSPRPLALRNSKRYRLSIAQYPLGARVVRLIDALTPPAFYYLSPHETPKESGGQHLLSAGSTRYKIFNILEKTVSTYFSDATLLESYQSVANTHRRYLPVLVPIPTPPSQPSGLVEPLIDGVTFSEAGAKRRRIIFDALLDAYAKTAQNTAYTTMPRAVVEKAISALQEREIPESLNAAISTHRSAIINCLTTSPLIPSHGDLYSKNLLVTDEQFYLIDLGYQLRNLPYFYDLLYLAITEAAEARPDILESLTPPSTSVKWSGFLSHSTSAKEMPHIMLSFLIAYATFGRTPHQIAPSLLTQTWKVIEPYITTVI